MSVIRTSWGGWLGMAALLAAASSGADGILVLKSQNSEPYNQAVSGFRAACACEVKEINLNGNKNKKSEFLKRVAEDKPRLIVTVGLLAAQVAKSDAAEIPMVFVMVSNPVRRGLQGDNIAGVSLDIPVAQQFTNYKALLPTMKILGVIFDPAKTAAVIDEARAAAEQNGIKLIAIEVTSQGAVPKALKQLLTEKIDAFWMVPDDTVITPESFRFLLGETSKNKLPFIASSENFVEFGALAALTPDYLDTGRQGYELVKAIESGQEKPASIGTKPPAKVNLVLNEKTASKIGLSIPPEVKSAASKIYQ